MDENVQIIELKQIPVIEERLRAVKEDVELRTQEASRLVCTDETVKDVKKTRAELNKEFESLEGQRKAVKKAIMAPYEAFETLYKECITEPFKAADAALKQKVDSVESTLKSEKEEEIRRYFDELCQAEHLEWYQWERTGIRVTLSASMAKLRQQVECAVGAVRDAVAAIDKMENRDEIMVEYRQRLSVSDAVNAVAMRKAALEEQMRQNARRREQEAQARAAAEAAEKAAEEQRRIDAAKVPEKVPEEPKTQPVKTYRSKFIVTGTLEQLKALKNFMESEDISYESAT